MTVEAPSAPPPRPHRHSFAARKRAWQLWLNNKLGLDELPVIRKLVWTILGSTVLLLGILMIVLPGPAIIFIPLGLTLLAGEFAWARRVVRRGRVFVGRRMKPKKVAPSPRA